MIKLVAILIMAPVNKGKVLFTCREATCGRNFTHRSNRDRHEKRFNHKPLKHKSKEPLFEDAAKKYKCATPGCPTTSEFKGNIVRHMKDCAKQKLERNKKLTIKYVLIVERFLYKTQISTAI